MNGYHGATEAYAASFRPSVSPTCTIALPGPTKSAALVPKRHGRITESHSVCVRLETTKVRISPSNYSSQSLNLNDLLP
jgi:hypothetical protein